MHWQESNSGVLLWDGGQGDHGKALQLHSGSEYLTSVALDGASRAKRAQIAAVCGEPTAPVVETCLQVC